MPRFLRSQMHGRRAVAQPDDADGDAAELARTPLDDEAGFNRPDLDTVLQRHELDEAPGIVVPVRLVDTMPIPVDNVPLVWGGAGTLTLTTTVPQKLLNRDPRRGAITFSTLVSNLVRIGRTQAEVSDRRTAYVLGVNQGPHRFHIDGEIWVMAETAPSSFSYLIEAWAR